MNHFSWHVTHTCIFHELALEDSFSCLVDLTFSQEHAYPGMESTRDPLIGSLEMTPDIQYLFNTHLDF